MYSFPRAPDGREHPSAAGHQVHNTCSSLPDISRSTQVMSPNSSSTHNAPRPGYGVFPQSYVMVCGGGEVDAGGGLASFGWGLADNWGESRVLLGSPRTETSAEVDKCERNRLVGNGHAEGVVSAGSFDRSEEKVKSEKTLHRLNQNRDAARRSRLRKKEYIQQLESSCLRLTQLEQQLQEAQQGSFTCSTFNADHHFGGSRPSTFDLEYAKWLEEHQKKIMDLRAVVNFPVGENELQIHVDAIMLHFDEVFRLKRIAAKLDIFHMLSGMWITPAERCFMWMGGFRSSSLLKIVASHVEPLSDQQLMGICNLQQSSQQAEDALSQGMDALQQSLTEILAVSCLPTLAGNDTVSIYMTQMANAMGKLGALESFLLQADLLRQQTLQQMHRILTTRQTARALLAINDFFSRLRALSSLWLARPQD